MSDYAWADFVGLLVKGHRTIAELKKLTGLSDMSVRRYLRALMGEGLVSIVATCKGQGTPRNVYGWTA